jgi:hypothetical protein
MPSPNQFSAVETVVGNAGKVQGVNAEVVQIMIGTGTGVNLIWDGEEEDVGVEVVC